MSAYKLLMYAKDGASWLLDLKDTPDTPIEELLACFWSQYGT